MKAGYAPRGARPVLRGTAVPHPRLPRAPHGLCHHPGRVPGRRRPGRTAAWACGPRSGVSRPKRRLSERAAGCREAVEIAAPPLTWGENTTRTDGDLPTLLSGGRRAHAAATAAPQIHRRLPARALRTERLRRDAGGAQAALEVRHPPADLGAGGAGLHQAAGLPGQGARGAAPAAGAGWRHGDCGRGGLLRGPWPLSRAPAGGRRSPAPPAGTRCPSTAASPPGVPIEALARHLER